MKQIDAGIHPVFASYQEWHDELVDGEKWIAKYAQSTKGQIRSLEGVNEANKSARDCYESIICSWKYVSNVCNYETRYCI